MAGATRYRKSHFRAAGDTIKFPPTSMHSRNRCSKGEVSFPVASFSPSLWLHRYRSRLWQDSTHTTPATLGDPVGAWEDVRQNGLYASQATAGKRAEVGEDGILSNGTSAYLSASLTPGVAGRTVAIVGKRLNSDTGVVRFTSLLDSTIDDTSNNSTATITAFQDNGFNWGVFLNDTFGGFNSGVSALNKSAVIARWSSAGETYNDIMVNGSAAGSGPYTGSVYVAGRAYRDQFLIFAGLPDAQLIAAELAEVIVIDEAISDEQRTELSNYLIAEHGLA